MSRKARIISKLRPSLFTRSQNATDKVSRPKRIHAGDPVPDTFGILPLRGWAWGGGGWCRSGKKRDLYR